MTPSSFRVLVDDARNTPSSQYVVTQLLKKHAEWLNRYITERSNAGAYDYEISTELGLSKWVVMSRRQKLGLPPNLPPAPSVVASNQSRRKLEEDAKAEIDGWPKIDAAAVQRMEANFGRKLWADDARAINADRFGRLPYRDAYRPGCAAGMCPEAA